MFPTACRLRLPSSLKSSSFNQRSLDLWLWPWFNGVNGGPHATVVEQYLMSQIKVSSITLLPWTFINSQAKTIGPIPISTYMRHCLSHPVHGFYTNPESVIFGSRRDLTTSPDVGHMFGEVWPGAILESKIER